MNNRFTRDARMVIAQTFVILTTQFSNTCTVSRSGLRSGLWSFALCMLVTISGRPEISLGQNLPLVGQANANRLTVESIFKTGELNAQVFSPNWEASGAQFVKQRPSVGLAGAFDLVRVNPRTNQEQVLCAAIDLVPPGADEPLAIYDHEFSPDGKWIKIYTNTRKVWRHNSRGDYWLLNLETKALRQLGAKFEPASLMFAKFSPDSQRVAFVNDGNVFVENVGSDKIEQLTTKAHQEIVNGTSDWVYEEEFDLKDCIRWSPDSQKIAFWEFDTSGVPEFSLINNTDSLYPTVKRFKHTKPGQKNSAVRMGVFDFGDQQTTWIKLAGDPRENYLARGDWVDADRLLLQHLNREQNRNSILLADAASGEAKQVATDTDAAWVDTCDDAVTIAAGPFAGQVLWTSESDGWRHLYALDLQSGEMTLLTPGDYDVIETLRVTDNTVYFLAAPENPTERYLYRIDIGGGEATRVTPASMKGWNNYQFSADGSVATHTRSQFGEPPITTMIELPEHQTLATIHDNQSIRARLAALPPVTNSFLKVGVGAGVSLDAWIMKPANFDPLRKYPLIVHVYGEPWGTTVNNAWGGQTYLWHRMLAEQGYAVCSIDNRGTKVPRGRDFRKAVYGQIGILAAADQAKAVAALTKHFSWLDSERVGVWGWSGGGSMTLNAMFKYPKIYHTGVAVAPVPDMRYYDSIYQERYMGLPSKNPDGYRNGSPIHFANQLQGNLLIVHGTGDDNCHYQTIELLINELVKHDKQFSLMAYPNRSHSINEGANTSVHLRKLMTKYFQDNLPAGGR